MKPGLLSVRYEMTTMMKSVKTRGEPEIPKVRLACNVAHSRPKYSREKGRG